MVYLILKSFWIFSALRKIDKFDKIYALKFKYVPNQIFFIIYWFSVIRNQLIRIIDVLLYTYAACMLFLISHREVNDSEIQLFAMLDRCVYVWSVSTCAVSV